MHRSPQIDNLWQCVSIQAWIFPLMSVVCALSCMCKQETIFIRVNKVFVRAEWRSYCSWQGNIWNACGGSQKRVDNVLTFSVFFNVSRQLENREGDNIQGGFDPIPLLHYLAVIWYLIHIHIQYIYGLKHTQGQIGERRRVQSKLIRSVLSLHLSDMAFQLATLPSRVWRLTDILTYRP